MPPTPTDPAPPLPDWVQPSLFDTVEVPQTELLSPDEIFERVDASLLSRVGEDKRVERKSSAVSGEALGDYLSMWANTAPAGGIVVVGISDKKGTVEGLKRLGTDGLNKLERAGYTYCPDAQTSTRRISVTNQNGEPDFLLVIRVQYQPNRVVRNVRGDAFVRWGDTKHRLSADEVRQLQADKNEVSFETERCSLEYPAEFDRVLVQRFADRVRQQKGWSPDEHPDHDVLTLMRLGKMKGGGFEPNIACALLFAKDPQGLIPGCKIRFLRFDGEVEGTGEKWNAIKDEYVEGQVPQLITDTETLLVSQLRTFSKLGTNDKFFTEPEYPKTAWYEALVNACVHRSYGNGLRNVPIFVKMFDDRLVIESPGPFPPFVTPENIQDSHHPRNPILMGAMQYLEFVKCAHEGTRRMQTSMKAMALPSPEFQQKESGQYWVRVTLRNNVNQRKAWVDRDVAELVGSILARSLGGDEKRLLNFAAEHGSISVSDAQRLLGCSWPAGKKKLEALKSRGILDRQVKEYLDRDTRARYRLTRE
jgi:ATP-dependent DNA helicase RecG